jgi:hypothetical protein
VVLSTNDGSLLMLGNCPPLTYSGKLLGWNSNECNFALGVQHPGLDPSQADGLARKTGLHNITHNLGKLPVAVPARFGRMLAVFRPSQTVGFVAKWMTTDGGPIWAWVVAYWLLIPFAIAGAVFARRSRAYILPLVGPLVIVLASVAISYGEPRYHTPSDLGVIVLAAAGIDRLAERRHRPEPDATEQARGEEERTPLPVA